MLEALKPLALQFDLNSRIIEMIVREVNDKEKLSQTCETINPPLWLIVHLTETRAFFTRLIGAKFKPSWGTLDTKGGDLGDADLYPEVEEIMGNWKELAGLLQDRLENLTSEELSKPQRRGLPIHDGTHLGMLTFAASHETYHVGQLGGWWKVLGTGAFTDLLYGG